MFLAISHSVGPNAKFIKIPDNGLQSGLEYRTLEYRIHWNTERFEVRIANQICLTPVNGLYQRSAILSTFLDHRKYIDLNRYIYRLDNSRHGLSCIVWLKRYKKDGRYIDLKRYKTINYIVSYRFWATNRYKWYKRYKRYTQP